MTAAEFSHIIQQPKHITAEQTEALKGVIKQYPYFQAARASYLKGLKNQESYNYNQELKVTAAYTTDRSILFDFITSEAFIQNEISQYIKQHTEHLNDMDVTVEDLSINKSIQIDDALKEQIKDTTGVLDPELFQPKVARKDVANFKLDESETIEEQAESVASETLSPDVVLNLGKPLQFDLNEKHSFNEWLMLTRFKPINREQDDSQTPKEQIDSAQEDRDKKFDLIDKFITTKPKLKPEKSTAKTTNLADAQMIQPEALMTETLARIYVEQKNYKKALQSYNILSLKYPEKSGFFADQIKAIKQLQEQNKE